MFSVRDGGRLDFLGAPSPECFIYFENRPRAMANICSGTVYVMSADPKNIHGYRSGGGGNSDHSMWNSVKRIAPRDGGRGSQTYAIDASEPNRAWKVNLETGRTEGDSVQVLFSNLPLRKRDMCGENLDCEPLSSAPFAH